MSAQPSTLGLAGMDENEMLRDKVLAAEGPDALLARETPPAASASSAELAQLRAKVKELQTKLKAAVRDEERPEADTYTHSHMHAHMHTHIHSYTPTHARMHIHACTHTRMHRCATRSVSRQTSSPSFRR